MTNGKPPKTKLQQLTQKRSQVQPAAKPKEVRQLAKRAGMNADDPLWVFVEAIGVLQEEVQEVRQQLSEVASAVDEIPASVVSDRHPGLTDERQEVLREQLREAMLTVGKALVRQKAVQAPFNPWWSRGLLIGLLMLNLLLIWHSKMLWVQTETLRYELAEVKQLVDYSYTKLQRLERQ